jgi:hypothetical protein
MVFYIHKQLRRSKILSFKVEILSFSIEKNKAGNSTIQQLMRFQLCQDREHMSEIGRKGGESSGGGNRGSSNE